MERAVYRAAWPLGAAAVLVLTLAAGVLVLAS